MAGEVYVDDGNEGADGLSLFGLFYLQLRTLKRVLFSIFRAEQVFLTTERRVVGGLCPFLKEVCFIFNVRRAGNFALVVEVSYSTTRVFLRAISPKTFELYEFGKPSRRYTISVMNLPAMARGRWLNACIACDMVWS